jgi:probable HAF family extracellular repeat protein
VNGRLLVPILAVVAVCSCASDARAGMRYEVFDLGTHGAMGSEARGLNEAGQVVGFCYEVDWTGRYHDWALLWEGPIATNLSPTHGFECGALDINDAGRIVGAVQQVDGEFVACLWEATSLTTLGSLLGEGSSTAFCINELGQVAGTCTTADAQLAFLWQDGVMTSLGTMEGGTFSQAFDINNAGQVVGNGNYDAPFPFVGFLWDDGVMTPLEGLQAAHAINDLGQVAGYAKTDTGDTHAFLWEDGALTDLGALVEGGWSQPWDINNRTQVVGYAAASGGTGDHAFLWQDGAMYDLNDLIPAGSEWELVRAHAINERGQIAGYGYIRDERHAFLLTPIPEPPLPALALLGLAALAARRTWRR